MAFTGKLYDRPWFNWRFDRCLNGNLRWGSLRFGDGIYNDDGNDNNSFDGNGC